LRATQILALEFILRDWILVESRTKGKLSCYKIYNRKNSKILSTLIFTFGINIPFPRIQDFSKKRGADLKQARRKVSSKTPVRNVLYRLNSKFLINV